MLESWFYDADALLISGAIFEILSFENSFAFDIFITGLIWEISFIFFNSIISFIESKFSICLFLTLFATKTCKILDASVL